MSEKLSFIAPRPYYSGQKVSCETEEGLQLSVTMPRAVTKGTEIQVAAHTSPYLPRISPLSLPISPLYLPHISLAR